MKKFYCLQCFKAWETETPSPCPHCKSEKITDNGDLMDLLQGIVKATVDSMKAPIAPKAPDNGTAGGDGPRKKSVVKDIMAYSSVHKENRKVAFMYEDLSSDMEEWGKALINHIKGIRTKAPHGMESSVGTAGGYLVPPAEFLAQVIEVAYNQSIFIPRSWYMQLNNPLVRVPRLAQVLDLAAAQSYFGGITFKWLEEAGTKQATKPEFEYMQLQAHELAALIPITNTLIEDSAINVVNYVSGLVARYFPYVVDNACINGVGGFQPLGIIPDPLTLAVARQGAGAVVLQDLINMDARLNEMFTEPIWLMRKGTGSTLRTELTVGNVPLWVDPWTGGINAKFQPPAINGWPVVYNPFCPAIGNPGDVILCDPRYYAILMRKGLTADESDHFYFDTNEKCLRFVARLDGQEAVHDAFVILDDAEQGS